MNRDEKAIRQLLESAAPPMPPIDFADLEQAFRRRRNLRWSTTASVGAVLAVVVVVMAVQRASTHRTPPAPEQRTPAGLVPWIGAVAPDPLSYRPHTAPTTGTSSSASSPATSTLCAASALTPIVGRGGGISQHWSVVVSVRNTGGRPCALPGPVKVVATQPGLPDVTATKSGVWGRPGPPARYLAPHAEALLGVDSPGYCASYPAGGATSRGPVYHHVRLELPGGGSITVGVNPGVGLRCGLEATDFWTREPAPADPSDPLEYLRVTLQPPQSVRAGAEFSYVVSLLNPSGQAIRLTPCPGYLQFARSAASSSVYVKQSYALNCAPVANLRPAQTARFEMRMTLPAELPPGKLLIGWSLVGPRPNALTATATTTITPAPANHS